MKFSKISKNTMTFTGLCNLSIIWKQIKFSELMMERSWFKPIIIIKFSATSNNDEAYRAYTMIVTLLRSTWDLRSFVSCFFISLD